MAIHYVADQVISGSLLHLQNISSKIIICQSEIYFVKLLQLL